MDIVPFVPSLAYRMCLAASGALDFAVSGVNSHDWDIAAADLMLEEAGGRLVEASSERDSNRSHIRRAALLGTPDALAPRLLEGLRAPQPAREEIGMQRLSRSGRLAFWPARGQIRATQSLRSFLEDNVP